MKNAADNSKQPISESNTKDFGVTTEMNQELQHFLVSRTEGKLWKWSMGQNGNQVWSNGEDKLLCVTVWQLDEVWMTASAFYGHQHLRK